MADLRERFRAADLIDPPDLWEEIEARKPTDGAETPSLKRVLVIALVLVLAAVTTGLAARPFFETNPTPGGVSTSGWSTYRNSLGWTMRYPPGWSVSTFTGVCRPGFRGAIVANVPNAYRDTGTPSSCSWPPSVEGLPSTAVLVEFDFMEGGPSPSPSGAESDTRFPLSIRDFRRPIGPSQWRYLSVQMGGQSRYTARVWFGNGASASDRMIASRIVASIRPPRGSALSGPIPVAVPDLTDLALSQAVQVLKRHGLGVGDLSARANGMERGIVLRQGVAPGSFVRAGTEIPLILSAGPHPNAFQFSGRASVIVGGTCDLVRPSRPSQPCIGGPLVVPLVPK